MFKRKQAATLLLTAAAALGLGTSAAQAGIVTIDGDDADYTVYKETSFLGTVNHHAVAGGGSTLQARWEDNAALEQDNRPIYQFDLSSLGNAVADAALRIRLHRASSSATYDYDTSFGVDLYGSTDNRASTVTEGDAGATSEHFDTSYNQLADPFAYGDEDDGAWIEADVTSFLQDRWTDYEADPSQSWVFFRLQADGQSSGEDFRFYSADMGDSYQPELAVTTVPEPASLALLALGGLALLPRRRRAN